MTVVLRLSPRAVLESRTCGADGGPRLVGVAVLSALRRELDAVLGAWLPRRGLRDRDLQEEACWGLFVNNEILAGCYGFGIAAVWQWRMTKGGKAADRGMLTVRL